MPNKTTKMITLYNTLLAAGMLFGLPVILPMLLISAKRRHTVLPRLGLGPAPRVARPSGRGKKEKRAVWVHALSVGETRSAVPLMRGIRNRFDDRPVLFSVTTKSGFDTAKVLLADTADDVVYFPYDIAPVINRVTQKIDPAIVIIVESDIWPNFLSVMKKRRIPVILCNGRLSDRSYARYRRCLFAAGPLFSSFAVLCVQSEQDARRAAALGADRTRIHVTGNVKFDQDANPAPPDRVKERKRALGLAPGQPVLLAGSTHRGEEALLLDVFSRLVRSAPKLRLILAPRDPARAAEIERTVRVKGFSPCALSALPGAASRCGRDVLIVDTLGVLKEMYALADIAFIGGSMVSKGGHNPLEPAAFAKPILFGPDMSDFRDIAAMLRDAGGAVRVADGDELTDEISALLRSPDQARAMGSNAYRVFSENKGAVGKTLAVVEKCLSSIE